MTLNFIRKWSARFSKKLESRVHGNVGHPKFALWPSLYVTVGHMTEMRANTQRYHSHCIDSLHASVLSKNIFWIKVIAEDWCLRITVLVLWKHSIPVLIVGRRKKVLILYLLQKFCTAINEYLTLKFKGNYYEMISSKGHIFYNIHYLFTFTFNKCKYPFVNKTDPKRTRRYKWNADSRFLKFSPEKE